MPQLPKAIHDRLAGEYRFAANRIAEFPDLRTKGYFFSVFHGEAHRQLNMHWDRDLNLFAIICQAATQAFLNLPSTLPPPVAGVVTTDLTAAIDKISNDVATFFEAEDLDVTKLHGLTGRIAELSYSLVGNGSYLYLKGDIKF